MTNYVLPSLVAIPLFVGIVLLFARRKGMSDAIGERVAIGASALLIALCAVLYLSVGTIAKETSPGGINQPAVTFSPSWLRLDMPAVNEATQTGWQLGLGADGIAFMLVLLTALVSTAVLVVATTTVERDRSDFAAWVLLATSGLMLTFLAMDLIVFYIGFELALIPLFPLIAFWGDKDAKLAAKRFVLYTLAGSIPMVLGLLGIAQLHSDSSGWAINFAELSERASLSSSTLEQLGTEQLIFGFLVLGLGVKMALIPFHTWLPGTYGSCHATAAAFLAAVVLKLGLFGFVRIALPLVPRASAIYGPTVMAWLGAIAIVCGALLALAQTDLKRALAYSSLSHVGFITLGLFAMNEEGVSGGVLQMFNHGITTAAVFLAASCLLARCGTVSVNDKYYGAASIYPKLGVICVFFLVAGAGVPGLNNFVGEALSLTATISAQPLIASVAALGVVFGAWYAFRLIQLLLFGVASAAPADSTALRREKGDVRARELNVFAGLAFICLTLGVFPQCAIDVFRRDVEALTQTTQTSLTTLQSSSSSKSIP